MAEVLIELIDASNWREALEVRVRDEQLPFVADHQPVALVILAKCFVRPSGHRWEPLLVRDSGGGVVGVLALEHGADACEVRNFAVDARRQGEGLGTAAMKAVIQRLVRPGSDCGELVVSAHPDNEVAHNAYRSAGFDASDETRNGQPVFRYKIDRSGAQ